MDYGRANGLLLSLRHRHSDGSWSPLEPVSTPDPSASDPERDWPKGQIYLCKVCEEQVYVESAEEPVGPQV